MKNALKDIIRQAIDIHLHVGPEIIPRKYTAESFAMAEAGNIGGAVLKNHFYPTQPFVNAIRKKGSIQLFGGIVLNNSVGGLNPEAVYSSAFLSEKPIMVWFPTINAENFLKKSAWEIAPEWVKKKGFVAQKAKDVNPVIVSQKNKLTKGTLAVLQMIKKCNAVLATGHISWQESMLVTNEAKKIGIKNIVITHPIYKRIDIPIDRQKELAKKGCFIEQSYSMYAIDKIPIDKIVKQIKNVGYESVILSSDVGQTFSPSPSDALYRFGRLLLTKGIKENELFTMMVKNPKKLFMID